jgi:hypothetical protein
MDTEAEAIQSSPRFFLVPKWTPWEIGADADVEEIAARLKEECVTKYAFLICLRHCIRRDLARKPTPA